MSNTTVVPAAVITIYSKGKSITTLLPQEVSVQTHANSNVTIDLAVAGKLLTDDSKVVVRSGTFEQRIDTLRVTATSNATSNIATPPVANSSPTIVSQVANIKGLTVNRLRGSAI